MQYYNKELLTQCPKLLDYFTKGITDETKNISHCLLFWGDNINLECALALEIARLLNCNDDKNSECNCINCRWIKEQTHPAVKIYTRLDFKENSSSSDEEETSKGKKNISVEQAKSIISELAVTSDYHRVYIFCDRDEDGNLLPLNMLNFPEATSNALLKTFEEPPANTTFIFLTKDPSDVISTVVSRCQSFFVPSYLEDSQNYSDVEEFISGYWQFSRQEVLDFENKLLDLISENEDKEILTQIQNYILKEMKSNFDNKQLFYKLSQDIKYVEDAKRQLSLTNPMNVQSVIENLCFKIILN